MARKGSRDTVLTALDELCVALEQNTRNAERIRERAQAIHDARENGLPYREIVTAENRPLVVELVTDSFDRLATAGSRLRRAEAAALHDEGMSMEAIAELFGVTRQRVSELLKAARRD